MIVFVILEGFLEKLSGKFTLKRDASRWHPWFQFEIIEKQALISGHQYEAVLLGEVLALKVAVGADANKNNFHWKEIFANEDRSMLINHIETQSV